MNRNDCKIVQDLLPNYIENLTSKETNNFIEEHLKECKECKEIYENMVKNTQINNIENNKKEAKYFKKFNNKLKSLKISIIIIIAIVLIIFAFAYNNIKNILLINSLEKKLSNINISNYSYTREIESNDLKAVTKCYVINEKYYIETEQTTTNGNAIIQTYKDSKDDIILYDKGDTVWYKINGKTNTELEMNVLPMNPKYTSYEYYSLMKDNIKEIVKEDNYYVVKTKDNSSYWIEMDTGIIVKILDINNSISLIYNFGNVKEVDIVKPDVSEYVQ